MAHIIASDRIDGIKLAHLRPYRDDRGWFIETFRKEWFPERTLEIIQTNRSYSKAGVLRGLHYHFRQIDYWYVVNGKIRVGLADLRRSSPTMWPRSTGTPLSALDCSTTAAWNSRRPSLD